MQLGIAIWAVNIINGIFSFWQEFQADKATEALANMLPSYTRVIRNGKEEKILAKDLVLAISLSLKRETIFQLIFV